MEMSEAAWVAIIVSAINMIGSVSQLFIRTYYRAHYGVCDQGQLNDNSGGPPPCGGKRP